MNTGSEQVRSSSERCAHVTVKRFQDVITGRICGEHWRCENCGKRFIPGGITDALVETLFPEQETMRDKFAMAALSGLLVQANLDPSRKPTVELAYTIADEMLEERK